MATIGLTVENMDKESQAAIKAAKASKEPKAETKAKPKAEK